MEEILKNLVEEKKRQGLSNDIIRNSLKEVLQFYVLDFIFNSSYGKDLAFTGGSALRIGYNLNRLSEDLDLDLEWGKKIDKEKLTEDILDYFRKSRRFPKIEASIRGKQKKIYLKFPILYALGAAKKPESDKLYVKVEIAQNISRCYQTEFIPVAKFNLNFLARFYSLETLMSSKIIAILKRTFRKGKGDKITFKGRDYYDILWFLQKGIKPDLERLKDVLNTDDMAEIYLMLLGKTEKINPSYLKEDLLPLFEDSRFMENYCQNYKEMVKKHLTALR